MKRFLVFATIVVLAVLVSGVLLAQSDPFIGRWKMNTAESKYSPGPAQQIMTWKYEVQGNGVKGTAEGTGADGSRFAYSVTANYDGKDYPVSGTGPSGADTVALKRVNQNTIDATWKKAGKVVQTARNVAPRMGRPLPTYQKELMGTAIQRAT